MAYCTYRWTNDDPNAERNENGKKIHPVHECREAWHKEGTEHICSDPKCRAKKMKTGHR